MVDIYEFVNNTTGKSAFIYASVLVIGLGILRNYKVKLNIILGLLVSGIVIIFLYQKNKKEAGNIIKQNNFKRDNIKPKLDKNISSDIVDYLYSIQDFYLYNPPVYEEIVENMNDFFTIYNNIHKDNSLIDGLYSIAEMKKDNILNGLHSIIHNMPYSEATVDKYNKSMKQIQDILNKYLTDLVYIHEKKIYNKGLNVNHKIINDHPKPYNSIDKNDFF